MKFNGSHEVLVLHQIEYGKFLSCIVSSRFTRKQLDHLIGQLADIPSSTRSDTAFTSSQLAKVKREEATPSRARLPYAAVTHLRTSPRGIIFDNWADSLQIRGYSDAVLPKKPLSLNSE